MEFLKFSLPVPDLVIFLDMPLEYSLELINQRQAKGAGTDKDIHEKSQGYLAKVYQSYQLISRKYGWFKINCAGKSGLRSVKDIHKDVYQSFIQNKI